MSSVRLSSSPAEVARFWCRSVLKVHAKELKSSLSRYLKCQPVLWCLAEENVTDSPSHLHPQPHRHHNRNLVTRGNQLCVHVHYCHIITIRRRLFIPWMYRPIHLLSGSSHSRVLFAFPFPFSPTLLHIKLHSISSASY